jgi:3-phosphoglycerate kinase
MKKTLADVDVSGKKVLVRVDYNVPIDENLNIIDDTRIKKSLPTIKYLLDNNASVILMSHLGRPNGKFVLNMSLKKVSIRLGELLDQHVNFIGGDCVDNESKMLALNLKCGEIFLLENLRFNIGEEGKIFENTNSRFFVMNSFAKKLASMCEIFVQDAFGTVHRSHSSNKLVPRYVKDSVIGFLVEKELIVLNKSLKNPKRPFLAIIGGSKISDKISIIENLLNKVDSIIIVGAMSYTFLKSQDVNVGDSIVDDDCIDLAFEIVKKAKEKKVDILFPVDHIVADKIDFNNKKILKSTKIKNTIDEVIQDGFIGVDVGSSSLEKFLEVIKFSKTIIWNGPLGIFEIDEFSSGTINIAKFIAEVTYNYGAMSIIGGGDSISAIKKAEVEDKITHISTGGGAFLKFFEGKELPGISVVCDKK